MSILSAKMPAAAIITTQAQVFLQVGELDHLGRVWQRFRRMEHYHLQRKDGVETVTIEFAENEVPDQVYPADQELEVLLIALDLSA